MLTAERLARRTARSQRSAAADVQEANEEEVSEEEPDVQVVFGGQDWPTHCL